MVENPRYTRATLKFHNEWQTQQIRCQIMTARFSSTTTHQFIMKKNTNSMSKLQQNPGSRLDMYNTLRSTFIFTLLSAKYIAERSINTFLSKASWFPFQLPVSRTIFCTENFSEAWTRTEITKRTGSHGKVSAIQNFWRPKAPDRALLSRTPARHRKPVLDIGNQYNWSFPSSVMSRFCSARSSKLQTNGKLNPSGVLL